MPRDGPQDGHLSQIKPILLNYQNEVLQRGVARSIVMTLRDDTCQRVDSMTVGQRVEVGPTIDTLPIILQTILVAVCALTVAQIEVQGLIVIPHHT